MKRTIKFILPAVLLGTSAMGQIWSESFSTNAPPVLTEDLDAQVTNEFTTGEWTTFNGTLTTEGQLRMNVNTWGGSGGFSTGTTIALDDSLFTAAGDYRLTLDIAGMNGGSTLGVRVYDASIGSGGTNNYYQINNYQWGLMVPNNVVPVGDATTNLLTEAYMNASHIGTRSVDFSYDGSGDVVVMLMAMSETMNSGRWILIDEVSVDLATPNTDVPVFTSATNSVVPEALEYEAYSNTTFVASVTDNPGGEPLTYSAIWSPDLTVSSNGVIYGTPTLGGTNTLTISVADADGAFSDAIFELFVTNVNDAPIFGDNEFWGDDALTYIPYQMDLNDHVTDEEGDALTFSGSGPAWLNIGTDGILSGTPGDADYGKNTFEVIASDGMVSSTGTLYIAVQKMTVVHVEDFSEIGTMDKTPAVYPSPELVTTTYTNGTWHDGGWFVSTNAAAGTLSFQRPHGEGGLAAASIVFDEALFVDGAGTYSLNFDIVAAGASVKTYVELHDLDLTSGTVSVPNTTEWGVKVWADPDGTMPDITAADGALTNSITNVIFNATGTGARTIEFEYDGAGDVLLRIGAGRNGNKSWWLHEIDNLLILGSSIATPYQVWADGYSLSGDDALSSGDPDGDGWNNLYEFGLGLDPTTNAVAEGAEPLFHNTDAGVVYIHAKHSYDESLVYYLVTDTDLVYAPGWVDTGYTVGGTDVTGGTYNYVTNVIDTADGERFIRLMIEQP